MATGSLFRLIHNDDKQEMMLNATNLLRERLAELRNNNHNIQFNNDNRDHQFNYNNIIPQQNITVNRRILNLLIKDINGECPICLDAFDIDSASLTSCYHVFCKKCIGWLYNKHLCPHCRQDMNILTTDS